ncbi:MAG: hypothetical protein ACI8UO_006345 [Verrucomicrobiales bacterium]|jgi:hypothetical protein
MISSLFELLLLGFLLSVLVAAMVGYAFTAGTMRTTEAEERQRKELRQAKAGDRSKD